MNQEKVGNLIKKIRMDHNLTQEDFAKELGVTYQAVSKWENGKSLPDISILKEICNKYNYSLNDLLDGNDKKKSYKFTVIILIIVLLFFIFILFIQNNSNDDFEFKQISSSCSSFNLSGTAAYNKSKTSLSISNIEFCGKENDTIYDKLKCNLYEETNNKKNIISKCSSGKNKSIKGYTKNLKINVDNYNSMCRNFSDANMYIEIVASKGKNEDIYKIPLKLDKNC